MAASFQTKKAGQRIPIRTFVPYLIAVFAGVILVAVTVAHKKEREALTARIAQLEVEKSGLAASVAEIEKEVENLKNEDQRLRNDRLEEELGQIRDTFNKSVASYEDLLEVKSLSAKTAKLDGMFATVLTLLSKRNYATASSQLKTLTSEITKLRESVATSFAIPQSVPVSNAPPGSGYTRQSVATDIGNYMVDLVAGDLSTTRVIVDSASDSDCTNDCPVLPLSDYVTRSGGYAGINGAYFCPAAYPSCAGKTNSFDTLLMNKNKKYINSANNVYSTVPAVIFQGTSVRFVAQSLEWGRDTGPDGVIANQPLLVLGGDVRFGGDGDPKKGSKGSRSFVASKGNVVYIGVAHNVTVAENALVLKALGMENAINLDSGGSTALYYSGYKVGPGRNIPNAIVFVRR